MNPILAYLDPVTGNALLQVLLAAAAAIGLGYQYIRRFIINLMSRLRPSGADVDDSTPSEQVR
jgi:hypothetical protein